MMSLLRQGRAATRAASTRMTGDMGGCLRHECGSNLPEAAGAGDEDVGRIACCQALGKSTQSLTHAVKWDGVNALLRLQGG
jgi:hypothetical protein